MGILYTIIIGFVVGIVARFILPGRQPMGWIMTTVLGIVGALLAGFAGRALGWYADGSAAVALPDGAEPIKFTSQTRVSGLQIGDRSLVKGAVDAVLKRLGNVPNADALRSISDEISRGGATPLAG